MSLRSCVTSIFAVSAALLWLNAAPVWARSRPSPTPSPSPTPVADPAITTLVRQQFVAWQAGSVNKSLYVPAVQAKLTDAKINDVSHALGRLGPLLHTVFIGPFVAPDLPPGARGYIYQMRCREGNVYLWLIRDAQGKIGTIFFKDKLTTETVEVPASAAPSPPPSP
jgi:hypothetical protein